MCELDPLQRTCPSQYETLAIGVFALLVGNRAGSLACGLAGCLALATAAFHSAFLQIGLIQRFDLLHDKTPISKS